MVAANGTTRFPDVDRALVAGPFTKTIRIQDRTAHIKRKSGVCVAPTGA
jgi:hypothetical protein